MNSTEETSACFDAQYSLLKGMRLMQNAELQCLQTHDYNSAFCVL
jgi:hypothetical protein